MSFFLLIVILYTVCMSHSQIVGKISWRLTMSAHALPLSLCLSLLYSLHLHYGVLE